MGFWNLINLVSRKNFEEQNNNIKNIADKLEKISDIQNVRFEEQNKKFDECITCLNDILEKQKLTADRLTEIIAGNIEVKNELLKQLESNNKAMLEKQIGFDEKSEIINKKISKCIKANDDTSRGIAQIEEALRLILVKDVINDTENLIKLVK